MIESHTSLAHIWLNVHSLHITLTPAHPQTARKGHITACIAAKSASDNPTIIAGGPPTGSPTDQPAQRHASLRNASNPAVASQSACALVSSHRSLLMAPPNACPLAVKQPVCLSSPSPHGAPYGWSCEGSMYTASLSVCHRRPPHGASIGLVLRGVDVHSQPVCLSSPCPTWRFRRAGPARGRCTQPACLSVIAVPTWRFRRAGPARGRCTRRRPCSAAWHAARR
jgi:hypothetical protein